MTGTPQNNVGAGAIPPWRTDGVQIANIFEWPTEPINSTLVGRSVALVYSTSIGGLIYSTDGENWVTITSGGDIGSVDTDARLAIGWPYTDPYSISTRLSAFDTAVSTLNFIVGTAGYSDPLSLNTRVGALEAGGGVSGPDNAARAAIGWPYINSSDINARLAAIESGTAGASDTAARTAIGWPYHKSDRGTNTNLPGSTRSTIENLGLSGRGPATSLARNRGQGARNPAVPSWGRGK
jgi:hypothetical protein